MWILTRRIGESLCIGDRVKITVLDVGGRFARIGVVAPEQTLVCNAERYEHQTAPLHAKQFRGPNVLRRWFTKGSLTHVARHGD